ncbi:hypothetical protein BDY21DRAFT_365259 [Lineolata rhizophorae]|uniref:Uncharacterized protein n=1 Tax=Lineolata rhizophorae TaxID=578093 RepID=A0A6A6NVG4_9PEZI|nr:hypothetical protein BDY21DRAFT_365259 [Lineolata rhizophorae]
MSLPRQGPSRPISPGAEEINLWAATFLLVPEEHRATTVSADGTRETTAIPSPACETFCIGDTTISHMSHHSLETHLFLHYKPNCGHPVATCRCDITRILMFSGRELAIFDWGQAFIDNKDLKHPKLYKDMVSKNAINGYDVKDMAPDLEAFLRWLASERKRGEYEMWEAQMFSESDKTEAEKSMLFVPVWEIKESSIEEIWGPERMAEMEKRFENEEWVDPRLWVYQGVQNLHGIKALGA